MNSKDILTLGPVIPVMVIEDLDDAYAARTTNLTCFDLQALMMIVLGEISFRYR